MHGGLRKHISLALILHLATPSAPARPVGGVAPQRNELNSGFNSIADLERQAKDLGFVQGNGQPGSGLHGLQDQLGLQDHGQFGGRPEANTLFHQNHINLFQMAVSDATGGIDRSFLTGLDSGVKNLRRAVSSGDQANTATWSKWLWEQLSRFGLDRHFKDENGAIKASDLGLALCVDGETATGEIQKGFETGLSASKLKITQTGGKASYGGKPGSVAGSNPPGSAPVEERVSAAEDDAIQVAESNPQGSAPRPPRVSDVAGESESVGSPARPSRGPAGPEGVPPESLFPSCQLSPLQNFNNQPNRQANNDKNKPNNKNPGSGGPGADPQQSPPPQAPTGGGGGGGGSPSELQPVQMPKLGAAPQFKVPGAEPDGFNYMNQIREYGQFQNNYNNAATISGMEKSSQGFVQQILGTASQPFTDFFKQGAVPAAPTNTQRLNGFSGSSNRSNPFGGAIKTK